MLKEGVFNAQCVMLNAQINVQCTIHNAQFIMHNVQWWDASSCVISQLGKARQEIFPRHLSCSIFAT